MPDYYKLMMRHGEFGVQAIVEQIERVEGIRRTTVMTLEERWAVLMRGTSPQQPFPQAAQA